MLALFETIKGFQLITLKRRLGTESVTSISFYYSPIGHFDIHTKFLFSLALRVSVCSFYSWWIVQAIKDCDLWTFSPVVLLWKNCTFAWWVRRPPFWAHQQCQRRKSLFWSKKKDALYSDSAPISMLSFCLRRTPTNFDALIRISCNLKLNSGAHLKKRLKHLTLQRLTIIRKNWDD